MSVKMSRLKLYLFKGQAGHDLTKQLNKLIDNYNDFKDDDSANKIKTLQLIRNNMQTIDKSYPPSLFASSKGYQTEFPQLFKSIKDKLVTLGIASLRDSKQESSSLSEIVANMSPEYANRLAKILNEGGKYKPLQLRNELKKIYLNKDNSQEATNFREFLQKHSINYLGGGNSKNYEVFNSSTQIKLVLKLDCRLDAPRNVEDHLRKQPKLSAKFTPVEVDRQVVFTTTEIETVSRTLLVTEFCSNGSVLDHSNAHRREARVHIPKIFEQMAQALEDIKESHCMFPDAKITNWLVDSHGNVRLADTKSFLFIDDKGSFREDIPGNEYNGFISTNGFTPPEWKKNIYQVDGAHEFILGKNLYLYAMGRSAVAGDDASNYNFTAPVFASPSGDTLKILIKNLVKENPSQRISVKDAQVMLKIMTFQDELSILQNLRFAEDSKIKGIQEQIKDIQQKIVNKTGGADDKQGLIAQLQQSVSKFVDEQIKKNVSMNNEIFKGSNSDGESLHKKIHVLQHIDSNLTQQTLRPLHQLESLKFGPNDNLMNTYIAEMKSKIERADPFEKLALISQMQSKVVELEKDNALVTEVKKIVQNLRENATSFTVGMFAKASRIEKAMYNIPLEERKNLLGSKGFEDVEKMIASHRRFGIGGNVYLNKEGEIDTSKAAASFKEFKTFKENYTRALAIEPKDSTSGTTPVSQEHSNKKVSLSEKSTNFKAALRSEISKESKDIKPAAAPEKHISKPK